MKRQILTFCAAIAWALGLWSPVAPVAQQAASLQTGSTYFCPMHLDVTSKTSGACSKCGMKLVFGDPWNEREYLLEFETTPAAPKPGVPVRFRFTVRDPQSRRSITDFAVVHDKRYHLFIVSQSLEHFAHIHPGQEANGSWTIDHVLPQPGYYQLYSDFLPSGGTPQVLARTLVTAGYNGDLASSVPTLVPDRSRVTQVGEVTVALTAQPPIIIAGRMVKLRFQLSEKGAPVSDLEPYLGAWGHTLVLSEDALEYVHAHPIEYLPPDVAEPKGGPTITFDAMFPRPGRYRMWTQFKRRGTVSTTWFTVEAVAELAAR